MMKRIILSLFLALTLGFNQIKAQCSGATATINYIAHPSNSLIYSFDWTFIRGNPSIQLVYLCNGVVVDSLPCLPYLRDSAAGPHTVTGSFTTTCTGTIRIEIRVWSNPMCGGTSCIAAFREIGGSPLPVSFKSFTTARNRSNVVVKWETASEQNNSGFAVERNINGSWQQVAFVASQALNGTSDALLSYQFTDINNTKGITQYRIRQIDIDAKSKYSEVRAVRGEGQIGKTVVYPNPSNDGKVNVVFEDANVSRDISVTDMSGRTVKQMRNVTNNNITITDLKSGVYNIKIVIHNTNESIIKTIFIN